MRLLLEVVAKVLFDAEIERADEVGKALGRVALSASLKNSGFSLLRP